MILEASRHWYDANIETSRMRYGLKKRVIGSEGTCKRGELTSRKRKGKDVIGKIIRHRRCISKDGDT